jgi:hypothetical protein
MQLDAEGGRALKLYVNELWPLEFLISTDSGTDSRFGILLPAADKPPSLLAVVQISY